MKYGITLAGGGTPPRRVEYTKKAAAAGLESVFTSDDPGNNAIVNLTAMRAVAPEMTVGSGILRSFLRHPVTTAGAFSNLATLGEGETILGFGTGTKRQNLFQYGLQIDRPVPQLRSVIKLVRAAWEAEETGGLLEWDDEFYKVSATRSMRPAPHAPIKIWIAGVNNLMLRLAGEVADGLAGHPCIGADYIRDVVQPEVAKGQAQSDTPREFEMGAWATVAIDDDRDQARIRAGAQLAHYLSTKSYQGLLQYYGAGDRYEAIREAILVEKNAVKGAEILGADIIDRIALTGTVEDVAQQLTRYEGIADHIVFAVAGAASTEEQRHQDLERVFDLARYLRA